MFENRTYRHTAGIQDLCQFTVTVRETNIHVQTTEMLEDVTRNLVLQYRGYIESYIEQFPEFATTLTPWHIKGPAPHIIRDMTEAGKRTGTGPMAAVAGAVSEHVGKKLLNVSSQVVVENGGDIFLKTCKPATIGIYAGSSPVSGRIGIKVPSDQCPLGVCTSSGTVGHSFSRGKSDAVCIVSKSAAFADAAATSIGNIVKSRQDITLGIETAKSMEQVQGILIVVGDQIGAWGDIEITPVPAL